MKDKETYERLKSTLAQQRGLDQRQASGRTPSCLIRTYASGLPAAAVAWLVVLSQAASVYVSVYSEAFSTV